MGKILAVSKAEGHVFSKTNQDSIRLIEGEGVEGDAHRGTKVKHRSKVKKNPDQPNLRQVHLIQNEIILELQGKGFNVKPATMGENITTSDIDLLALPTGTILELGSEARIQVTGMRNPCVQLDNYQKGLMAACLERDADGGLVRKTGIMSIVLAGGLVNKGDTIKVVLPPEPHEPMVTV